MPTLDFRLANLEKRRPRRPAPLSGSATFDPTRLTMREQEDAPQRPLEASGRDERPQMGEDALTVWQRLRRRLGAA